MASFVSTWCSRVRGAIVVFKREARTYVSSFVNEWYHGLPLKDWTTRPTSYVISPSTPCVLRSVFRCGVGFSLIFRWFLIRGFFRFVVPVALLLRQHRCVNRRRLP